MTGSCENHFFPFTSFSFRFLFFSMPIDFSHAIEKIFQVTATKIHKFSSVYACAQMRLWIHFQYTSFPWMNKKRLEGMRDLWGDAGWLHIFVCVRCIYTVAVNVVQIHIRRVKIIPQNPFFLVHFSFLYVLNSHHEMFSVNLSFFQCLFPFL